MSAIDIANNFFAAVRANDVARLEVLYHDDLSVWQSCVPGTMDKAKTLEQLRLLFALGGIDHEIEEQFGDGDRCYQRCHVRIAVPDGIAIEFHSGMSIAVREGRIYRIHEFVDSSVAAAIGALLAD